MHVFLWIVQILLAAAFGMAGVMKATNRSRSCDRGCRGWRTSLPARCGSSASWSC